MSRTSWPEVPLEELYAEPSRNGLTRPRRVRGSGYKMINMGELFDHDRIRDPKMERVPMNEREKREYSVQEGDLLFARQSLVAAGAGKCSIVLEVPELTTFESHLIRVRLNKDKASPLFYYYYFSSPPGKANMQSIVRQVAAAGIRGSELAKLTVPLPSLPIQRKIAAILSAYDDMIENNTRRIAILEEMAQMLYREWFVHFRFPDHEGVAMVDVDTHGIGMNSDFRHLSLIPEGWKLRRLGDLANRHRRGADPEDLPEDTPYIGLGHMPKKSIALAEWGSVSESKSRKYAFKEGEILFGRIRPYFHKVGVAPVDGVCSTDIIVIDPKRPEYFSLVLSCVSSNTFVEYATQTSSGTKMPRARWKILVNYPVPVPPEGLLLRYNGLTENIVRKIQNLIFRNQMLRRVRDLLLPRLVSGELHVSE